MSRPLSALSRLRLFRFSLAIGALGVLALPCIAADLNGPSQSDRNITTVVTGLLKSQHISKHPLDDEISKRTLASFLKALDPMKVYFYQSDVDTFARQENEIDDMIKRGDVSFGYTIFKKLLERIDERVALVDQLLAEEHDFTVDEEMVSDPDLAKYAASPEEARDLWRKRIKYDLLMLKLDNVGGVAAAGSVPKEGDADVVRKTDAPANGAANTQSPTEKLTRRYHNFAKRMHQTDADELLEMYLTSLTTAYDPHTTFMSQETLDNFEIQMRLNLEGIGAVLQMDDGYTMVSKVVPGGAADKDKRLKPKDRIVGVGQGATGEIVDTADMKLDDVVGMIRGKRGTVVRLQVSPEGSTERKIYDITREKIALKESEARAQILERQVGDRHFKLGVIDLPSFYMDMEGARSGSNTYKSTTRDMRKILEDFKSQGVEAVIVDLRRNGGGSLTEAISVTGLFIDQGPIVQVKGSDDQVDIHNDEEAGTAWEGPLVVLTSKFSASASEIFAGAIQDYERGLIVGDKATHGKGTVQNLLDLGRQLFRIPNSPPLGALKITMQQFYRPNGDSTQNRGVLADIPIPSLTSQLDVGESDLDYALDFDQVDAARYSKLAMVDPATVDQLNKLSTDRRTTSADFAKVARNIARYHEQKAKKTITLNETKFLAERAEMNAEKEQEKELEELNDPNRPVFDEKNYYNTEAVNITLDYLRLMRLARVD